MSHPLTETLKQYILDFHDFKESHDELNNSDFNRLYGFTIDPPMGWPVGEALNAAALTAISQSYNNFVVVYSSTDVYNKAVEALDNLRLDSRSVSYFSWHEFYSAAGRAAEDMTYLRRLKQLLQDADIVFFLGATSALNDVVDQIRASATGCLITVG